MGVDCQSGAIDHDIFEVSLPSGAPDDTIFESEKGVEEIARSTLNLTHNVIKNQATDPVSCLPVEFDSSMHRLPDHFLTTFHGTFWEAKAQINLVQGPDPNTVIIIKDSIGDKARLLSLMACVAAYTERLIPSTGQDSPSTAL